MVSTVVTPRETLAGVAVQVGRQVSMVSAWSCVGYNYGDDDDGKGKWAWSGMTGTGRKNNYESVY